MTKYVLWQRIVNDDDVLTPFTIERIDSFEWGDNGGDDTDSCYVGANGLMGWVRPCQVFETHDEAFESLYKFVEAQKEELLKKAKVGGS